MQELLCVLVLTLSVARDGVPPEPPVILEPANEGQVVHPGDVHMATALFASQDPDRTHDCTDWEIWQVEPPERVWAAACAKRASMVHIHLGDGEFENSHAARRDLQYDTNYSLRVRHKDDLGQWSVYSERRFRTGPPWQVFPLKLENIQAEPAPQWVTDDGAPLALPPSASLRVEADLERPLLEFRADGLTNYPGLDDHVAVRVRVRIADAADAATLPPSQIRFTTEDGEAVVIYLPELQLSAPDERTLWISANGSSYWAVWGDTPNFGLDALARSTLVPWAIRQPGYKIETVATGFQLPVAIAFVPNPGPRPDDVFFYVAELYGAIKVVTRAGQVSDYAANVLNFDPNGDLPGSGEVGIGSLLVEPETGDLLVSMVYSEAPAQPQNDRLGQNGDGAQNGGASPGAPPARGADNPILYNGVFRLSSDDGGRTLARKTPVLLLHEETGASHQVSQLTLGLDGKLYVHIGDGFWINDARNLHSTRGKILRVNRDGSPCDDNPFYDPGDGLDAADYVFALGFRNPFGGAWRAADLSYYEIENGPAVDRFAKVVRGRDYLWDGTDASMRNFALYNWDPAVAPVQLVFLQRNQFNGGNFPAEKMGRAFVSEFGALWVTGPQWHGKRISEFALDAEGNLIEGPTPLVVYDGVGRGTVTALAAGPDGLYFTDFFKDDIASKSPFERGAAIFRIRPVNDSADEHDGDGGAEPPVLEIVCPHDLAVLNAPPRGIAVNFDPPEVRNARGAVTLVYSHQSGDVFPIGTTEVTCAATDETNVTAICAFRIIVVASKPGETIPPPPVTEVREPVPDNDARTNPDLTPTLCGYGLCGGGLLGMLPWTLLGLTVLKARRQGRRCRR